MTQRTFLEFFASGGMARVGLGVGWRCLFVEGFGLARAAGEIHG